jgi:hypothetical protein
VVIGPKLEKKSNWKRNNVNSELQSNTSAHLVEARQADHQRPPKNMSVGVSLFFFLGDGGDGGALCLSVPRWSQNDAQQNRQRNTTTRSHVKNKKAID